MVTTDWEPFCGKEFGRSMSGLDLGSVLRWSELAVPMVAGNPVVCDLPPHLTTGKYAMKHRNSELGFAWW